MSAEAVFAPALVDELREALHQTKATLHARKS